MRQFFLRYREMVRNSSPWYKMLLVLFLVLMFFLITGVAGLVIVMVTFNLGLQEVSAIMENPDSTHASMLKIFQVVQGFGMFIIPAFIAAYFLGSRAISYLNLNRKPSYISVVLVFASMVLWIPSINFIAGLNARLDLPESLNFLEDEMISLRDSYNQLTYLFLDTTSTAGFFANLFIMAILPALGEELLFRGIFQRLLAEWTRSIHWGIVISALLFSFFHFEFYGFLPRFLLGVFFGYLFAWTSSIWIPMLAHFVNNAMIVCYFFFQQPGSGSSNLDELGTNGGLSLWISLGGGIALTMLLLYHERSNRGISS